MNTIFRQPTMFPISLGYSCHPKVFIEHLCELDKRYNYPRQIFDWMGTPMNGICKMIKNNFEDLNNRKYLVLRRRFEGSKEAFLTHKNYNVTFVHDYGTNLSHISEEIYAKVEEDYKRRIERWNKTLETAEHILFIRLEQKPMKRIVYDEASAPCDELASLKEFANLMIQKGVKFHILYLSLDHPHHYDNEHNIITVHFAVDNPHITLSAEHIEAIITKNIAFIRKCLTTQANTAVNKKEQESQIQTEKSASIEAPQASQSPLPE